MVRLRSVAWSIAAGGVALTLLHCVGEDPPVAGAPEDDGGAEALAPDGDGPTADALAPRDGGFCLREQAPQTRFCSDFDDGTLPGPWQGRGESADAGLSIVVGGGAVSPPGALEVFVPASVGSGGAHLEVTLPGPFATLACSFQLRGDLVGGNLLHVLLLDVKTSGDDYDLLLLLGADQTRFVGEVFPADGGRSSTVDVPATLPLSPGAFRLVAIEIAPPEARLLADGNVLARVPIADPAVVSARLALGGIELLGHSDSDWRLRFDDVVCRATP